MKQPTPTPHRPPVPKAVKAWRSSVNEVAKIVLGVLIALGLGAVATGVGWRIEVGNARRAIAFELGETVGQSAERMKYAPCVERRLDELAAIIDASLISGRVAPSGDISMPPFRTWNRGVWDSAVSSQAAAHFPREEAGALTSLNEFVSLLQETSRSELNVWTRLHAVVGPGRAISDDEIVSLRQAVGEARLLHRTMAMAAIRSTQIVNAYHLTYDGPAADDFRNRELTAFPICKPIGTIIPTSYGHAPLQGIIAAAAANPITRASAAGGPRS